MNKSQSVIDYLATLSKVFSELNDTIVRLENTSNLMEGDMELFKNLEFSNDVTLKQLEEKFSPQKLMLLIKIFFQINEFAGKYSSGIEEKIKEYEYASKLIKEINSNLKELLGEQID